MEIRFVREFLQQVWQLPEITETRLTLFRGQPCAFPVLPKLFRSPNTVDKVRCSETEMLGLLRRTAPHLLPSRPDNDWEWLSLGQHYGLSTRMSDWTANPLVALFFALELALEADVNPVVYCYPIKPDIIEDQKSSSPFNIPYTRVIRPVHSHRSEAQAAWHVVHAIHLVEGAHTFIPLEQMPPHGARISKISISYGDVFAIRGELSQMGLTHSALYGDFGSVCRSIAPLFGLI